jgi:hypothetical protein
MGKQLFIVLGLALIAASFVLAANANNAVSGSMVWTLRFMGGFFVLIPLLTALGRKVVKKNAEKRKSFFMQNGIEATATMLSAQRTGMFLNKVPQIQFEFEIESKDLKTYTASVKKYIRFVDYSNITEGMKIPAYIHPEDRENVLIMWEKAGFGEAF